MSRMVLLMLLCLSVPAFAQDTQLQNPGRVNRYPTDIKGIRDAERLINSGQDFEVLEDDQRGRRIARVRGLPPEFRDLVISDDQILVDAVIPGVYAYFAFTGSESLKFSGRRDGMMGETFYDFEQYINDMESVGSLIVRVHPSSHMVIGLTGTLDIDKGYDTVPSMSVEEAIDHVFLHIKAEEEEIGRTYYVDDRSAMKSRVRYVQWEAEKGLQPAWVIDVPLLDPTRRYGPSENFIVLPDGTVQGGMRSGVEA